MKKPKFYVVWKGKKTGIFNSWSDCEEQILGVKAAQYMSFDSLDAAQKALKQDPEQFIGKNPKSKKVFSSLNSLPPKEKSICVDGAWNTKTGDIEYQGVDTQTKKVIFHQGPFADGTNNIAEFLAIVHALAFCKQTGITLPIYSDSRNAILWVKQKTCRTKLEKTSKNTELFNMLGRAILWLQENSYDNKILKWETQSWGENPADFGRK